MRELLLSLLWMMCCALMACDPRPGVAGLVSDEHRPAGSQVACAAQPVCTSDGLPGGTSGASDDSSEDASDDAPDDDSDDVFELSLSHAEATSLSRAPCLGGALHAILASSLTDRPADAPEAPPPRA